MKPTLEEVKNNYERVLLQLDNGRLAGIKRVKSEDYYVVEQQDWNYHAVAIELSRGYNRESDYDYNIARIKFLDTKNELTDFMDYGSETDITDWDWDINNPHNLKFKKGDVVRICKSESRIYYDQMRGRIGTIVDAEYKQYVDDERITYRVRVDDYKNEYQDRGLWVFHDESSLELYNPQCDDQMDAYEYVIQKLGLNNNPHYRDYIIKGEENNMNKILEIYEDRKFEALTVKYNKKFDVVKATDENYKIYKECVDRLAPVYEKTKQVFHDMTEPYLTEETNKKLAELEKKKMDEHHKLNNELQEISAQLSMCETYEQKQDILKRYGVIDDKGKINA